MSRERNTHSTSESRYSSKLFSVGLQGGVRLDGVARGAAEELPRRFAGGFALDIPKSHIDGADGVDDRAASSIHAASDVKFLPQPLGIEWVLTNKHFLEAKTHGVCAGSLDAGSGDSTG